MTKQTQGERMAVLEEQGKRNLQDHSDILVEIQALSKKFDKLDSKYSSKWVESAMTSVISLIVLTVVGALVALVINKQ